ncbi:MAG: TIGR02206 family membrane protein [Firmicutes bacterium HGW-Firmicutes-10]|nr:MAG: TIGR02206 family membrane protein [Firmicutes bacterium HGW-Firmicutes-10]
MLTQFFGHYSEISYKDVLTPFSSEYNLMLLFSFLLAVVIFVIGSINNPKQNEKTLKIIIFIIVVLEVSRQIWAFSMGNYLWSEMLPLHLCGIQIFLMPLMLKTRSPLLKNFVYLTAFPGALAALLFNETVFYKYPVFHFQSIQTFVIHTLIMIVPIFMMVFEEFRPKLNYILPSTALLALIAVFNGVVNIITGGNYLFIATAPADTPIAWIADVTGWPGYIPVMIVLVIIIWLIMVLPFIILEKHNAPLRTSPYRFRKQRR